MNKKKNIPEEIVENNSATVVNEVSNNSFKATKLIGSAFNFFDLFDRKSFRRTISYIIFLTVLGMLYISNSYYTEKVIRKINSTEKDIKELRSEFITGKSELMCKSQLSEVAKNTSAMGLKESTVAPKKIIVHIDNVNEE